MYSNGPYASIDHPSVERNTVDGKEPAKLLINNIVMTYLPLWLLKKVHSQEHVIMHVDNGLWWYGRDYPSFERKTMDGKELLMKLLGSKDLFFREIKITKYLKTENMADSKLWWRDDECVCNCIIN